MSFHQSSLTNQRVPNFEQGIKKASAFAGIFFLKEGFPLASPPKNNICAKLYNNRKNEQPLAVGIFTEYKPFLHS